MSHSVPLTKESYESLQEELKRLIREERPRVIQDIAEARSHGDLSENAEYDAAKHRQSFIEGRIQELSDKLARAYVVDLSNLKPDKVVFGATVSLYDTASEDEVTYKIVGEDLHPLAQIKRRLVSSTATLKMSEASVSLPEGIAAWVSKGGLSIMILGGLAGYVKPPSPVIVKSPALICTAAPVDLVFLI